MKLKTGPIEKEAVAPEWVSLPAQIPNEELPNAMQRHGKQRGGVWFLKNRIR
ncbi:hypothetical protein [Noviherbaspirillum cavernae]|uniref:hypothetical protein n=1 Tax=Noviherbaspirillum cavernae TaxID=2320862 RepID=UPI001314BA5C|nr:hypothetical protein [Noviherbaspirillum cavernae]